MRTYWSGLGLQFLFPLLGILAGLLGIPIWEPVILLGVFGEAGSVTQLVGAVRSGRAFAQWAGGVAAILNGIAWGSWVVVGATSEPDDPIINVTGLLIVPGLILSVVAGIAGFFSSRRETSSPAGASTHAALFATLSVLLVFLERFALWMIPFPYILAAYPIVLVLGLAQVVEAWRARATSPAAAIVSALAGLTLVASIALEAVGFYFSLYLYPLAALLSVVAAVVEWVSNRRTPESALLPASGDAQEADHGEAPGPHGQA